MQLIKPKQQQECLLGNQTILSNSIPAHAERFFFLSLSHSDGMEITGNEQRQARAEQITMDQVSTRAEGALKGGKLLMWLFLRVWRPAWRKFRLMAF